MSTFKKLKRDCTHERGYNIKNDRCIDCGVTAKPSVQIEELHQQLLKAWVNSQGATLPGSSVKVPTEIMIFTRLQAQEMYLDKQHQLDIDEQSPIVSLQ